MKRILLLALLIFGTSLLAGVKEVDIARFETMRKQMPVVDIRTPAEWRETGIIPGSHTITFFQPDGSYDVPAFIEALKKIGITKETPFILVCRSASRTRLVGNFLADKMGYEKVYHLKGGILNWIAHKKPLAPYRP